MPLLIPPDPTAPNLFGPLRLLLALIVVCSHSVSLYFGNADLDPLHPLTAGTQTGGTLAVRAFLVISGFLVALSFDRSTSVASFMARRVRRVYPGFVVAFTVCVLVVVPMYAPGGFATLTGPRLARAAYDALTLQFTIDPAGAFANNPVPRNVNGSLWTVAYEFRFYLALALFGVLTRFRRPYLGVLVFAALLAWRLHLDVQAGLRPADAPSALMFRSFGTASEWADLAPAFVAGTLAYLYRHRLPRSHWVLAALTAMYLLGCHLGGPPLSAGHVLRTLALPPLIAYAVLMAAYPRVALPSRLHLFDRHDYSYGTYLYAFPIQQALVASLGSSLAFTAYLTLSALCAVLAGAASWYLIERPCIARRRPASPAAAAVARA